MKTSNVFVCRDVDISYYWIFVKPEIRAIDFSESSVYESAVSERIQDVETVFSIDPEGGVLSAGKTARFMLTFAPAKVICIPL